MRTLLLLLLLTVGATAGSAQELTNARVHLSRPEVQKEIVEVVTAQLMAFRASNWAKAYSYSAESFQGAMPLDTFIPLISKNYVVVWKNTRFEVSVPSDNGRIAILPVRVFGEGRSEAYNWMLVKDPAGWRITGVVPQQTNGA